MNVRKVAARFCLPPMATVAIAGIANEITKTRRHVLIMCFSTRCRQVAAVVLVATLANSAAYAMDRIRVAAQITGTLGWELEVMRAHELDRKANLDIETTQLASTEAGQIALRGGSVDLIVSDWLWVSRERTLGDDLVFYPYSSTLGAVMVPASSP